MRLSTVSALFLAVSTAFAAPLDNFERRQEAAVRRLALRNDVAYTGGAPGIIARSDLENYLLEVRSAAKKQANKAARKERKAAAKSEVHKAGQKAILETNRSVGKKTAKTPEGKKAAAAAGHTAATNRKAELKAAAQAKHDQLKAAGAEHRKATNLPHRTDTFHVAAGGGKPARTYTGKDVRKANFASHIKNSNGDRFGKPFNNNEHAVPGADGSTRPVPHMTGVGHEHPLSPSTSHTQMKKDHKAEPARVISQSAGSNHQHQAVIAHDQSRTAGHPGENDHFMVNPAHATRPAPLDGLHGTFMHTRRSGLLEAFEY